MIRHASTRRILKKLDALYDSCSSAELELSIAYSKLASLEVCGWLEESFDEIAHNCVRRRLRTIDSRKHLVEKILTTHGFDYKSQSRPLLTHALGVIRLLEMERRLDRDGSLELLKSTTGSLKPIRRDAAHTSIAGTTETYPAPSIALQRFETCLPILQKMWQLVRELS